MREKKAKKLIKEAGGSWEVFMNWMIGQTYGFYKDGQPNYYDCDVERFIRYSCNPKNEPLAEWD